MLVGFLIATGWSALATLGELHQQEQAARINFLSRTEPLIQVRSKLIVYGDLMQESPLQGETSPEKARQLFAQIESELGQYPQSRMPEEQALLNHLQGVLSEGLPSHLRAIAATEQITLWNTNRLRSSNAQLLASFTQMHNHLKRLLLILLGSALAITMGSVFVISAQEKEIRKRYVELQQNHDAQEQLSKQLLNAQEQERLAISRELHDEVGQSLEALLVDMGRMSAILPSENSSVQDAIRQIRNSAERSVSAVRNIALLLRPSMLDDLGLVAAIEWQAREISRRSDVEVEVEAGEISAHLKEEAKICLYRLTQEALNNVARHSGARHAWVSLKSNEQQIHLKIRDDGKGFDPERTRGLGLLGMKERLRLLHGFLEVRSAPGTGTEITAELPIA